MIFEPFLKFAVDQRASDVHLQAGSSPMLRIGPHLRAVEGQVVGLEPLKAWLATIAPAAIVADLPASLVRGAVFLHTIPGVARFRCSLFSNLGEPGLCLRVIPLTPPSFASLGLPQAVAEVATGRGGLTLIAGESGSGRSTTLTAMVDLLNDAHICKVVTIEDPVEFVHTGKKAMISHRSVGIDTPSFAQGVSQALRQDPDVLVLGKVPDAESVRLMLSAAEGGRQVIAVTEAPTAVQAIQRLLGMLDERDYRIGVERIAGTLDAVIVMRLASAKDGRRVAAVELLRGGPAATRALTEGRWQDLATYMTGRQNGMQTFDQHLSQLYQAGIISGTEAMHRATNPEAILTELRTMRAAAGGA